MAAFECQQAADDRADAGAQRDKLNPTGAANKGHRKGKEWNSGGKEVVHALTFRSRSNPHKAGTLWAWTTSKPGNVIAAPRAIQL